MEEVLCKDPPWLPRNATGACHPLDGVERLLDVQFRLLRHDSLQSFFDNAQQLLTSAATGGPCLCNPRVAHCDTRAHGKTTCVVQMLMLPWGYMMMPRISQLACDADILSFSKVCSGADGQQDGKQTPRSRPGRLANMPAFFNVQVLFC